MCKKAKLGVVLRVLAVLNFTTPVLASTMVSGKNIVSAALSRGHNANHAKQKKTFHFKRYTVFTVLLRIKGDSDVVLRGFFLLCVVSVVTLA